MYKNPKNNYERKANEIYEYADKVIRSSNLIFSGFDRAFVALERIYQNLSVTDQQQLANDFCTLFEATDNEGKQIDK